jgi:hypothetical protein
MTHSQTPIARWRINMLRMAFLILAIGQAAITWPMLLNPPADMTLMGGAAKALIAAIGLCSVIGVFRPLAMLPVMLVEVGWKAIWMTTIALPAWLSGALEGPKLQLLYECLPIIPFALLIPWDYFWKQTLRGQTTTASTGFR